MAQRNIDFGSFPGDPNADAIRTAFNKVQLNFTELFNNKKEQVYSVNRTPGAGIVLSTAPTGNVVVNAKIAQVRIQSSTLDLSAGIPGVGSQAVITSGAVPIFINLPANINGVSNINLSGALTADGVIANYLIGDGSNLININTAKISNGTSYANISASGGNLNIVIDGNTSMNVTATGANITGTLGVTGNLTAGNLIGILANGGTSNITIASATGNITTAVAGTARITATSTGANVTGTLGVSSTLEVTGNANVATNLGVAGITSLGLLGNVKITGGLTGQYIRTDGTGNLSFSTVGDADNVLYVSKSGNDSNDGETLNSAKLTIAAAVAIATPGTNIFVKAGDYTELNPISLAARVTIVGDNLRAVTIRPVNRTQDIFWVRPGCYITGVTFRDHLHPSAAVAFPTSGAGFVSTSPYVQNCSSIASAVRETVTAGSFVTGYSYKILSVGTTDFTLIGAASNTVGVEFTATGPGTGNGTAYLMVGCGMRIDGDLALGLKSMVVDSYTQFNQGGKGIHILNSGYAQLVSVFTICTTIGVHCESGGTCSISNSNNSFGDYALWAEGYGPLLYSGIVDNFINGVVTISGLTERPKVNDSFRFDGDLTKWYTVRSATAPVAGVSVVQFDQPPGATPAPGTPVKFYQASFISASGQTFEYVGTGTDILTATPRTGGIPIQANEVIQLDGGIVNWTSTDQFGDFRIGEGIVIKEEAGIIEGPAFEKGLFVVLTPYILALEN